MLEAEATEASDLRPQRRRCRVPSAAGAWLRRRGHPWRPDPGPARAGDPPPEAGQVESGGDRRGRPWPTSSGSATSSTSTSPTTRGLRPPHRPHRPRRCFRTAVTLVCPREQRLLPSDRTHSRTEDQADAYADAGRTWRRGASPCSRTTLRSPLRGGGGPRPLSLPGRGAGGGGATTSPGSAAPGPPGWRRGTSRWTVAVEPAPARMAQAEDGMVRLFIDAGSRAGVRPGDIVGAIANEAGVPGKAIGSIDIYDGFTFVELPSQYRRPGAGEDGPRHHPRPAGGHPGGRRRQAPGATGFARPPAWRRRPQGTRPGRRIGPAAEEGRGSVWL